MGRRPRAVGALFIGLVLLLGDSRGLQAANVQSASPTLHVAVSDLPLTIFPIGAPTPQIRYLRGFTGRSLTIYDKSWAVACALCTELPTLENGRARIVTRIDGSRGIDVTFDLTPDLAWDDGVPVTTADVLFSIEIAHKLGDGAATLSNILEAVAEDEHRFTLRISSVRFDYNRMEELFLLPAHREKAIFDAAATLVDYRARSLYTTDPTAPGLSYGPFKVGRVAPDEILLSRNPHWHGKQPNFDQIVLRKFTGIESLASGLAARQIDMVAGETGLDLTEIYRLEAEDKNSAYNFIYKSTLQYGHIDINLSNPLLQDQRIRKAMLLGLDRPITGHARDLNALEEAPRSFLPPTSPNFDPTIVPTPYDPARAAALLEAAGFSLGSDGIRADAQGRRLAFHLAANLDWDLGRRVVESVKDQWRSIGIDTTLENRRMSEILAKRQFDLAFYTWINTPEFLLEPVYGKSGIPTAENGYRGLNFPGFDNEEMNRVVSALTGEMDPAKRLLLWRRAQQIYAEEIPALPIAFGPIEYIVPVSMTGVEPTGHMIPTSYWVEDWKLH
jgi:peptide/nickel transport system substrate-binding protein